MERRVNQHQAIGGLEQAITVLSVAIVTREALNERYRAGVASLLELLDAEDVEQRARQGRMEAEFDPLTAQAALLRACGLVERLAECSADSQDQTPTSVFGIG